MDKFYITTPIYYASDKPHIGHAFTTIYADVIARFWRHNGKDVFFLTGTDEHGSKIAEKAKQENKSPQDFVDEISQIYQDTWKKLNIEHSKFIRTTSEEHKKGVYAFMEKIKNAGDIYEGEYEGLYCVQCERFYTEKELANGLCPDHLIPPQKITEKNYFFNLNREYLRRIYDMLAGAPRQLEIIPHKKRLEIIKMIEAGIPDFSITRENVKWGIDYPYDQNQRIYVWVEALMNYVTALDFPLGENFKKYWPADVHIIGAEINKFHSIFWPALLMSVGKTANIQDLLPRQIFVHGLFTINGQKMSKTLGNVIDPLDMAKKFGPDATRYLLLSQFPATEHGDIKESGFAEKYNADLANGIGNLAERVFAFVANQEILKYEINTKAVDPEIKILAQKIESEYRTHVGQYELFEALQKILLFAGKLNQYINEKSPWTLDKNSDFADEAAGAIILNSLFFGIEKIAVWLTPFMPNKMAELNVYMQRLKDKNVTKGEKLNLFPRIIGS